MAQNSFAIFFMLVLAGCGLSLLLAIGEDWRLILSALAAKPAKPQPAPAYRTTSRTPAELPIVAQRLVPRGGAAPPRSLPPQRTYPRPEAAPRLAQLALPLVGSVSC